MKTYKEFMTEGAPKAFTFWKADFIGSDGPFSFIWWVKAPSGSGSINIVQHNTHDGKTIKRVVQNGEFKSLKMKEINPKEIDKAIVKKLTLA